MKWLGNIQKDDFHIVRHGKWYAIAPAIIILLGAVLFLLQICKVPNVGFNLGLDFTGGAVINVTPEGLNSNTKNDFIQKIENALPGDVKATIALEKNTTGGNVLTVKFNADIDKANEVRDILRGVPGFEGYYVVSEPNTVGASTRTDTIINIMLAVLATLFCIMVYMAFRFKFTSGFAAIIALFHDVLVMAILVMIFRVQINASFIAALITIVGYSINNTLVLFDKVREYERVNATNGYTLEYIVDKSIKDTLGRTTVTTLTTLVPVLALAVYSLFTNLSSLTEFSIPIIFGLIAGTYSSILLATSMYLRFESARLLVKKRKMNTNKQGA
jgi:preprotein translocase SecF subunit